MITDFHFSSELGRTGSESPSTLPPVDGQEAAVIPSAAASTLCERDGR